MAADLYKIVIPLHEQNNQYKMLSQGTYLPYPPARLFYMHEDRQDQTKAVETLRKGHRERARDRVRVFGTAKRNDGVEVWVCR